MKKIFRKNQVIITTLAFLIAVAGYISYDRTNGNRTETTKEANADAIEEDYTIDNSDYEIYDEIEDTQTAETMTAETDSGTEEILNPGETVLTSSSAVNGNYAAEVKLNREQVRSKNKETLLEIINNTSITEDQKQNAIDEMVNMTDIAEKEADAEMMLEAKGFTNVVVSISGENCDVVLDMGDVTDAKRAQVEDIVKRKTGIAADKIVITTINTDAAETETN